VLTDSGGIQEEASFLGKQIILLRVSTERDKIPFPYIQLVAPPYNNLSDSIKSIIPYNLEPCTVYGEGNTSKLIINYIIK
jgi:UDP-N-acetylglucosamine 2-epimerase (non-hydrolysing)